MSLLERWKQDTFFSITKKDGTEIEYDNGKVTITDAKGKIMRKCSDPKDIENALAALK